MTAEDSVVVEALHRTFGTQTVLDGVDLRIKNGEFVALVGRSGGGKTTLLRILAGLESIDAGTVQVPEARSVVFQESRLLPWMPVWRNVVLGLRGKRTRSLADAALSEVGLSAHSDAWPLTLSGGEAQRTALARALVREPQLLLLDEPFGALDALTRLTMHRLVQDLHRRHRPAVLLVTHDVDEALVLGDRVLVLDGGHLIELDVGWGDKRPERGTPAFERAREIVLSALGVGDLSRA